MSAHFRSLNNPSSLIPDCLHNPQLLHLVENGVTMEMIEYVARFAVRAIRIESEAPEQMALPTPPPTPQRVTFIDPRAPPAAPPMISLEHYIYHLVKLSNVQVSTLLTTLVYLERLRRKLPLMGRALPCTRHRVFLATLIVTAKYLNDSSPKNCHWAKYAGMFEVSEINLMEMQLLYLLDYDLRFNEADACRLFSPFMTSSTRRTQAANIRASAVNRVVRGGRAREAQAQAQQVQLPTPPEENPPPLHPVPAPAPVQSTSSSSPLVRRVEKPTSKPMPVPPPMYSTASIDSVSSSSSSEMGSLVDDSGSSSSSSGWMSSDSELSEDEQAPQVYQPQPQQPQLDVDLSRMSLHEPAAVKKPYPLRAVPSYTYRALHLPAQAQARARKPSDTSSVHTVTAASPIPPAVLANPRTARLQRDKRSSSISLFPTGPATTYSGARIPSSSTMPSFLSRMWGAATKIHDKERGLMEDHVDPTGDGTGVHLGHGAFRRLVQSSRMSAASRGQQLDV